MRTSLEEARKLIIHHCDKLDDTLIEKHKKQIGVPCVAKVFFKKDVPGDYIKRDGEILYLAKELRDINLFKLVYKSYWEGLVSSIDDN